MGNCQKDQNEEPTNTNNTGPVNQIRITNFVWNKDYEGLFDYDGKSIEKRAIKVNGNAILGQSKGTFTLMNDDPTQLNQEKIKTAIFRLVKKENFYHIYPICYESENYTFQKLLWLVVPSLPNKCHQIQEKDILKLGKQKIRVRQIVYADSNPSSTFDSTIQLKKTVYENLTSKPKPQQKNQSLVEEEKQNHSQATDNQKVCRICLDPGLNENPLITPCKCSGSVKYIHLNCLRSWLAKRLNAIKNKHCITINWLPLSCEMCKSAFRYRIYMDDKKFYTVEIPKPPKPYMVIELMRKSTSSKGKIFHLISFSQKNVINLGRKKDIDVRISDDISISRNHASIAFNPEEKTFTITDNKSKFGTLVLIKKGLIVRPKFKGISFQIGAQVYSFEVLRGIQKENTEFVAEDGEENEYLIDGVSDDEEDIEENNDESQSQSQNENNEPELVNSSNHRP